jgi:hypothetical protein
MTKCEQLSEDIYDRLRSLPEDLLGEYIQELYDKDLITDDDLAKLNEFSSVQLTDCSDLAYIIGTPDGPKVKSALLSILPDRIVQDDLEREHWETELQEE